MQDLIGSYMRLDEIYRMYIKSAFPLRYAALSQERERLMKQTGNGKAGLLSQPPLLETIPVYPSSGLTLAQAADHLPAEYADLPHLAASLFDGGLELYKHQWESVQQALSEKRDIVVTTGTGSGKTEAFLLPLLAELARESASWQSASSPPPDESRFWWRNPALDPTEQWAHVNRPMAIRSLIMYPLNALVEDQLRRLRATLDNPHLHRWFDQHRGGNRITYGRYNGLTPVPGYPDNRPAVTRLRRQLHEADQAYQEAQASPNREAVQWYFPNPAGGEMWSRWDMQATPPDILITNYSMLNIMLMRQIEQPMFEQTRAWLDADSAHIFHLVIDELHAYRGTPGTEVAYILRLLLHRLGLEPDSPQLRILATSASLAGETGRDFLRQFFGREADRFHIINSPEPSVEPTETDSHATLQAHYPSLARFAQQVQPDPLDFDTPLVADIEPAMRDLISQFNPTPIDSTDESLREQLGRALRQQGVVETLQNGCRWADRENGGDGVLRPAQLPQLDRLLFPDANRTGLFSDGLRGLLLALAMSEEAQTGRSPQPVRGHLFFHNLQNLWVCTNPNCDDSNCLRDKRAETPLPVGALHDTHRLSCACGARVLDFIVCEVCGELFVGGFKSPILKQDKLLGYTLTPDQPDLEGLPDNFVINRSHEDYAVFWPQPHDPTTPTTVEWGGKRSKGQWVKAMFNVMTGVLQMSRRPKQADDEVFGWYYQASQESVPAMPPRCPRCDADYSRRKVFPTPLRNHRTGFQKAAQVLASGLLREMPTNETTSSKATRKLVVFSDSRQDAAKLAAGMEQDHYRDLVRMALVKALGDYWANMLGFLRVLSERGIPSQIESLNPILYAELQMPPQNVDQAVLLAQRNRFARQHQDLMAEIQNWWFDFPVADAVRQAEWESLLQNYGGPVSLLNLQGTIAERLLELGVNFGGADFKLQTYQDDKRTQAWHTCYNWSQNLIALTSPFTSQHRDHLALMNDRLTANLMFTLFTHATRTLEGLSQAWVTYRPHPDKPPSDRLKQATDAVIRMLGIRRRHRYSDYVQPGQEAKLPVYAQRFVQASGVEVAQVIEQLTTSQAAQPSQSGLVLDPEHLYLMPAPSTYGYECPICRGFYLHPATGICPECTASEITDDTRLREVAAEERAHYQDFDYYRYLSEQSGVPFRMNAAELTGQTDKDVRVKRQRWFQEIFNQGEVARPQGVDLLSVTTTMEAGVDIGALLATMMSNMPPRRFNYQQRVGRAGRRKAGVSLAVTFCRGRSHDDFYYQRPEKMTGDPPPQPYIDLTSAPIFKRALVKEVLRQIFAEQPKTQSTRESVHGEFGTVTAWLESNAARAHEWLSQPESVSLIQQILTALLPQTQWMHDAAFRQEMLIFVRESLLPQINEICEDNQYTQAELSERLANAGLLPMFGFPTRVRLLHTHTPRRWPPESGVVDRDLDIAISQFAPGSETVKDKAVHTACGVVEFGPGKGTRFSTAAGFEPPLPHKNSRLMGLCSSCRALVPLGDEQVNTPQAVQLPPQPCPVCGAEKVNPVDAREPKGFFTDFAPRDFNGYFEWTPYASAPTINFQDTPPESQRVGNSLVSNLYADIVSINDNNGQGGFAFQAVPDIFGQPSPGAYAVKLEEKSGKVKLEGETFRIALLSKRRTDILLLKIERWSPGVVADPTTVEGRAAWYSFAFWLRLVAATYLDVDPSELQAGFRTIQGPAGEVFLADRLENGAGYCRHLSQPDRFAELLRHADPRAVGSLASQWLTPIHAESCDASCNLCLRDYTNLAYHSLLDWRLALDMAQLAQGKMTLDLTTAWGDFPNPYQRLIEQVLPPTFEKLGFTRESAGGLSAYVKRKQGKVWLVGHPLWQADHSAYQTARQAMTQRYPQAEIGLMNPPRALRRPADYV